MHIRINTKVIRNILLIFFLGVIVILNLSSIRHKTLTYDEKEHYRYGLQMLEFNSNRFDDSKMPFSAVNAVPHKTGDLLKNIIKSQRFSDFLYKLNAARFMTVLFSLLLAGFVFRWTEELYGTVPGFFSLFLYTFSPNIIAHSRLVTTDLYAACMVTISLYFFWKFLKFGGLKKGVLSAVTLGLSQLAKYTCVYLYPIFAWILIIRYWRVLSRMVKERDIEGIKRSLKASGKYLLLFIAVIILVVNTGFLFNRAFTSLDEYSFRSGLFKAVQSLPVLKDIPIPLPYPYIEGLDWVKTNEETGETFGNIYLFGDLRRTDKEFKGFKGYFFYAFLYKVPISVQVFIFFALVMYVVDYKKFNFMEDELFLLCPIIFFAVYFNFFYKAQIGIRHILVCFPLLFVFCGSLVKKYTEFGLGSKCAVVLLMVWLVVSVLSYFPHYISYFNELVWDRKKAYEILADSNVDWGQNKWYLTQYIKENPDVHVSPPAPRAGRVVVSVNELTGVLNPGRYRWLRENFEPVDHIAYSYLVYNVSPEALKDIGNR
ncbi:MAG: glycosyltransferase family 39 protein [Deltaproteobacteria bacterium]|nr:glycosyltransferase family 39 protein [Deltaproteobacteria bacterium]MBL7204926.1 glycosyltransferase family 39 protein [Desulfobacteraceae bacterium]